MKEENLRREAYQIYFQILALYRELVILFNNTIVFFLTFSTFSFASFNISVMFLLLMFVISSALQLKELLQMQSEVQNRLSEKTQVFLFSLHFTKIFLPTLKPFSQDLSLV